MYKLFLVWYLIHGLIAAWIEMPDILRIHRTSLERLTVAIALVSGWPIALLIAQRDYRDLLAKRRRERGDLDA